MLNCETTTVSKKMACDTFFYGVIRDGIVDGIAQWKTRPHSQLLIDLDFANGEFPLRSFLSPVLIFQLCWGMTSFMFFLISYLTSIFVY